MRNSNSENGLSLLTIGLEKDLSTPSSSRRLSSVASYGIAVVRMEHQGGFMLGGDSPTLVTHTLPTAERRGGTTKLRILLHLNRLPDERLECGDYGSEGIQLGSAATMEAKQDLVRGGLPIQ